MDKKRDSFFLSNKKDKKSEFKKKQQDNFNANRAGLAKSQEKGKHGVAQEKKSVEDDQQKDTKKPFDKKTYRLKKYSKKYKLEKWEEQRKKKLLHTYYKDIKNDPEAGTYKPISFDEDTVDSNQEVGKFVRHPDLIEKENSMKNDAIQLKNKDPFWKAKEQYNKIKQDKIQKKQDVEKIKEEKRQKLEEYKKKKQDRFKKLSKKTKKGQPVMTGRLELLLEKIQQG